MVHREPEVLSSAARSGRFPRPSCDDAGVFVRPSSLSFRLASAAAGIVIVRHSGDDENYHM